MRTDTLFAKSPRRAVAIVFLAATLLACSSVSQKKPAPATQAPDEAQALGTAPAAIPAATLAEYESAWDELMRLEKANKDAEVGALLARQLGREDFASVPTAIQHKWLHHIGLIYIQAGAHEKAHFIFDLTSGMPEANEDDWRYRFISAQKSGARADAILALTRIARRWPGMLEDFDPPFINRVLLTPAAVSEDEGPRLQLLEALYAAQWKLDYGFEPSQAWADLARLLLERNDVDRALAVAGRITAPRTVLAMRVDKRFDALVRTAPERFDVDAAMARQIGVLEELSAQSPRKLALKYELIYTCLDAAQYERALRMADAVLAGKSLEKAYDDYEDQINWILDARSHALQDLGRWREAQRYLEQAAARLENGRPNISNAINLAMLHAQFGRSREALAALGTMAFESEGVSSYGGMQIHYVTLLAALATHDAVGVENSLDFMRENQSAAFSTYQAALLSANELGEAANLLIRRLRDPALRSVALAEVQGYRVGALTPGGQTIQQRWLQLKARSDVQVVLAELGRVEQFSLEPEIH